MFDKYKTRFRRLLSGKQQEHYESQSLLNSSSIERLEVYAEGLHDAHNVVYWVIYFFISIIILIYIHVLMNDSVMGIYILKMRNLGLCLIWCSHVITLEW